MVAIVVEPSLEGRASEVIPYRGDRASEGYPVSREGYPASRRSSLRTLFRIKPGGSRFREPITCHDITKSLTTGEYQPRMRTEGSHDPPVQKLRTDRGGISGKNPSDGLVRPARKLAKSVTETNSKVREPKTYNEAINNPIHGNRWREAINEELWSLDSHQTWFYPPLPPNQKAIGYKWVFKVKHHPGPRRIHREV